MARTLLELIQQENSRATKRDGAGVESRVNVFDWLDNYLSEAEERQRKKREEERKKQEEERKKQEEERKKQEEERRKSDSGMGWLGRAGSIIEKVAQVGSSATPMMLRANPVSAPFMPLYDWVENKTERRGPFDLPNVPGFRESIRNTKRDAAGAGSIIDDLLLEPLDWVAQVGSSALPLALRGGPATGTFMPLYDWVERNTGGFNVDVTSPTVNLPFTDTNIPGIRVRQRMELPDVPSIRESAKNTRRDADPRNYKETVSRFRDRPLAEQLVGGMVLDPTNLIGASWINDLLKAGKHADEFGYLIRQAARESEQGGDGEFFARLRELMDGDEIDPVAAEIAGINNRRSSSLFGETDALDDYFEELSNSYLSHLWRGGEALDPAFLQRFPDADPASIRNAAGRVLNKRIDDGRFTPRLDEIEINDNYNPNNLSSDEIRELIYETSDRLDNPNIRDGERALLLDRITTLIKNRGNKAADAVDPNDAFRRPETNSFELTDSGRKIADDIGKPKLRKGEKVYYHGSSSDAFDASREGTFVTDNLEDAVTYALLDSRLTKKPPRVFAIAATEDALVSSGDDLAATRGAMNVIDPSKIRVVGSAFDESTIDMIDDVNKADELRLLFGPKAQPGAAGDAPISVAPTPSALSPSDPNFMNTLTERNQDKTWLTPESEREAINAAVLEEIYDAKVGSPFRELLEELAWRSPEPSDSKKLEAERKAAIKANNNRGFAKPKPIPLGDVRIRARELLDSLPASVLEEPTPDWGEDFNKFALFEALVSGSDQAFVSEAQSLEDLAYRTALTIARGNDSHTAAIVRQADNTLPTDVKVSEVVDEINSRYRLDPTRKVPAVSTLDNPDDWIDEALESIDNTIAQVRGTRVRRQPVQRGGLSVPLATGRDTVYAPQINPFTEYFRRIRNTKHHPISRIPIIGGIFNPSARFYDDVSQAILAHQQQISDGRQAAATTVEMVLDKYINSATLTGPVGQLGTVFKTNRNGIVKGLNVHYLDILSQPQKYKLNDKQIQFVADIHALVDDANQILINNGMTPLAKNREGWFYVPRKVASIEEVEILRRTDPHRARVYEFATDAVQSGVEYSDIRTIMKAHLDAVYAGVAREQFSHFIEGYGVSASKLVPAEIRQAKKNAAAAVEAAKINLIKAQATNKGVKKAQIDLANAKAAKSKADKAFSQARERTLQRETLNGKWFGIDKPVVGVQKWNGRYYLTKDAEKLSAAFGDMGIRFPETPKGIPQRAFFSVANIQRLGQTIGDFAMPFNHGLPSLFYNPVSWGNMAFKHYYGYFDPTFRADYLRKNWETIKEMKAAGVDLEDMELFEAISQHGTATKAGRVAKDMLKRVPGGQTAASVAGNIERQTIGRFQSSYNTGLMVARVELWKMKKPRWKGTDAELANRILNMTGGLNSRKLGITPDRQSVESMWFALSPRLFRSSISFLGEATNINNPTMMRSALGDAVRMASIGSVMFIGAGLALGMSPEEIQHRFNPTAGAEFMSLPVYGHNVGIGGVYRSLATLVAESIRNPEGLTKANVKDNPLLYFLYTRGAPGVGLAGNIIEGTTGLDAAPFDVIDGMPDMMKYLGTDFLPIAASGYMEARDEFELALSEFGLRSPEIPDPNINDIRNEEIAKMFPELVDRNKDKKVDYHDLNMEQKIKLNKTLNENPMYQEQVKFLDEQEKNSAIDNYFNELAVVNDSFYNDMYEAWLEAQSTGDFASFNEFYKKRNEQRFTERDTVERTYKSVMIGDTEQSVWEFVNKDKKPEDAAVDRWYNLFDMYTLPDGNPDFEKIEAAREKFMNSLPSDQRQYVERRTQPKDIKKMREWEKARKQAVETAKPYFELEETLFDAARQQLPFYSQFRDRNEYDEFVKQVSQQIGLPVQDAETLLGQMYEDVKIFNRTSDQYKRGMRLADPELDRVLVDWYGFSPANRIAYSTGNTDPAIAQAIANDSSINSVRNVVSKTDPKPVNRPKKMTLLDFLGK